MAWHPNFSPKQLDMYRSNFRFQLAVGARYTGKTWALEHSVFRHCWRNRDARVGIISKTARTGVVGIWPELERNIFPEWVAAGVCSEDAEFGWVKKPHTHPVTKIMQASVRNRYGGASEIMLFPVERAEDAVEKLFSTQFSALWISEAHTFSSSELFKVAAGQLRMPGIPFEEHRLFCDANPPEEGTAHWLYEEFYRKRLMPVEEWPAEWDAETRQAVAEFQSNSGVWQFLQEDNPFADARRLAEFRALYSTNPVDYRRFVLGQWVEAGTPNAVFSSVWDPNLHVVGNVTSPDESDWEVIFPDNGPSVQRDGGVPLLVGGWDPGEVNHAWVGLQPWTDANGQVGFDVLDELFFQKGVAAMSIKAFTQEVLAKRKSLAQMAGFPVTWQDYGDSSAMKARSHATSQDWQAMPNDETVIDAAIISGVSDGEIQLIGSGAVKRKGWQQRRVNFVAELLRKRLIRVSANCKHTIRMFENLRKDQRANAKTYLEFDQKEKHIFDALSYPICMMLLDQLTLPPREPRVSTLKSV